jgi:shikimate 5-dehydrogenase
LKLIKELFAINPSYFDLEYDVPKWFAAELHRKYPQVQLICSYHNFNKTPQNLNDILTRMIYPCFSIYKIATKANSTLDALKMLHFVVTAKAIKICGICMGKLGTSTRILAPIINQMNYVVLEKKQENILSQLSINDLYTLYSYHKLNTKTKVYALLGDPVIHSQGDIFHNQKFQESARNAVYLKLKIAAAELEQFFQLIKQLPFFKGFSVTMPLKEKVIPYLDEIDNDARQIRAVNTILFKDGKCIGFNSDGIGALNAIENHIKIKHKKIVIIGAGGTARAIAYEALQRGAIVTILNRTVSNAKRLAIQLNCKWFDFNHVANIVQDGYDILVNATSLGMDGQPQILPVATKYILPGRIVLDMVSKPLKTLFIRAAQRKKCICILGQEVFINQAVGQQHIWL